MTQVAVPTADRLAVAAKAHSLSELVYESLVAASNDVVVAERLTKRVRQCVFDRTEFDIAAKVQTLDECMRHVDPAYLRHAVEAASALEQALLKLEESVSDDLRGA